MTQLYPLKFEPILKEKIWGGNTLASRYGKKSNSLKNIGESWELSALKGDLSVVTNGFLADNNIEELIEVYMGDLIGDSIYDKFGNEFPLLIKLIEAREDLSVQVHPGNELARNLHNAYGKTEMWYILESSKDSRIYSGFSRPVSREDYLEAIGDNKIQDLLNIEIPQPGDAFFTPAGRIHAIGAGTLLAEIQQTSDVTYRIYDWGRTNSDGTSRELHTDLAVNALDFSSIGNSKIRKEVSDGIPVNLVKCEFFDVNVIHFHRPVELDYNLIDSFIIYLCTEGKFFVRWNDGILEVVKGETVLLPATMGNIILEPQPDANVLEIYIVN
jgi:mannose-6-phosphate isomerase